LRDEFASGVEFESTEVGEELVGRREEEIGEGKRCGFLIFDSQFLIGTEVEFYGAGDAVEAGAVAFGAGLAVFGDIVG
jgi:hypothetical protein